MKKMIALLLLALLLCGCSVSIPTSVTVEKETEPVDPMSVELISIDSWAQDTGLVLNVCIDKNPAFKQDKNEVGTEFEMVLNMFHCVLEINPLGQKAEALLAGNDFSGVFYQTAMTDILTLAQKQQMIETSTIITVSATAVGTDSWTLASYNILERPIEMFQQDCGVFFSYKINAAGKYFDEKDYTAAETDNTRITEETMFDGTPYVQYSRAEGNRIIPEMSIISRPDGTIEEDYRPSHGDRMIGVSCSYHPDGSFSFLAGYTDNLDIHYIVYPDNTFESNSRYNINGISIRERFIYSDGSTWEYFSTENGNWIKSITTYKNGDVEEGFYDENGIPTKVVYTDENGAVTAQFFDENCKLIKVEYTDENGVVTVEFYDEVGRLTKKEYIDENGVVTEEFYDEYGNVIPAPNE